MRPSVERGVPQYILANFQDSTEVSLLPLVPVLWRRPVRRQESDAAAGRPTLEV